MAFLNVLIYIASCSLIIALHLRVFFFTFVGHIGSNDVELSTNHLSAIQNQMQSKGGYEMNSLRLQVSKAPDHWRSPYAANGARLLWKSLTTNVVSYAVLHPISKLIHFHFSLFSRMVIVRRSHFAGLLINLGMPPSINLFLVHKAIILWKP